MLRKTRQATEDTFPEPQSFAPLDINTAQGPVPAVMCQLQRREERFGEERQPGQHVTNCNQMRCNGTANSLN